MPPTPPAPGAVLLKASASPLQPDVWKIGNPPDARIWKTFDRSPLRATIGRYITRREVRNLRALDGLEGVPRLLGRPQPWTIEMTFLDAEPVPDKRDTHVLDLAFFDRLERLIADMHRRGMNHGDIRRKNLLRLRANGAPCLVDFAQSMKASSPNSLLARLVLPRARHIDRLKFLKIKKWYLGYDILSAEERAEYSYIPAHLKLGRWFRKKVYRPVKYFFRGRRAKS